MSKALESLERLGRYEIGNDEQNDYTLDLSDADEYKVVKQALTAELQEKCQHTIFVAETTSQIVTYCSKCGEVLNIKPKPPIEGCY